MFFLFFFLLNKTTNSLGKLSECSPQVGYSLPPCLTPAWLGPPDQLPPCTMIPLPQTLALRATATAAEMMATSPRIMGTSPRTTNTSPRETPSSPRTTGACNVLLVSFFLFGCSYTGLYTTYIPELAIHSAQDQVSMALANTPPPANVGTQGIDLFNHVNNQIKFFNSIY